VQQCNFGRRKELKISKICFFFSYFSLIVGWLQREDFHEMVKNVWERSVYGENSVIRWNKKMRAVREHLSG
jgi:hypothetical protein